jgi:hypothetical protein
MPNKPYLASRKGCISLLVFWRDRKGRVFADLHQDGASPYPVNVFDGLSPEQVDDIADHYYALGVPVRFAWCGGVVSP